MTVDLGHIASCLLRLWKSSYFHSCKTCSVSAKGLSWCCGCRLPCLTSRSLRLFLILPLSGHQGHCTVISSRSFTHIYWTDWPLPELWTETAAQTTQTPCGSQMAVTPTLPAGQNFIIYLSLLAYLWLFAVISVICVCQVLSSLPDSKLLGGRRGAGWSPCASSLRPGFSVVLGSVGTPMSQWHLS